MRPEFLAAVLAGLVGCIPDAPRPPAYPMDAKTDVAVGRVFCGRLAEAAHEQKQTYNGWGGLLVGVSAAALTTGIIATVDAAHDEDRTTLSYAVPIAGYSTALAAGFGAASQFSSAADSKRIRNDALKSLQAPRTDRQSYDGCLSAQQND